MKKLVLWLFLLVMLISTAQAADKSVEPLVLRDFSAVKSQMKALSPASGRFQETCSAVLKGELIYDQYQKLSSRYRVEQYYNWACQSSFSSSTEMKDAGISLGIPLEGLPSPLRLDGVLTSQNFKESLNQWCSSAWSHLQDQATYEEFSRVVNQGMVSAYKACIDAEKQTMLQKHGAFGYVTPQDDFLRKFIITLEFRPPNFDYKPRIKSLEGSEVQCTYNGAPLKTPFDVTTATLALTCNKSVDDSRIISFNTEPTGAIVPAKLPGLSEGIIVDLTQRTKGLAQSVRRIETAPTVNVFQCPSGTQGWNPGGAWGFYGCTGQITTSPTCSNIEYPHVQTLNCAPLGAMRRY